MVTSYNNRLKYTPSYDSGRWSGTRGESLCAPKSEEARRVLEEHGLFGIEYHNAVPDFSPVSESTVYLGYMTDARHSRDLTAGRDGKDTVYAHYNDGVLESDYHYADSSSMDDLHMKYFNPGNFEQADILAAEQWTADGRDGRVWTAEDVALYRQKYGFTWHECNDMETMQLVPEVINADFDHLGGVGEVKAMHRFQDEIPDYDEIHLLDAEDIDKMTSDEINALQNHDDYEYLWGKTESLGLSGEEEEKKETAPVIEGTELPDEWEGYNSPSHDKHSGGAEEWEENNSRRGDRSLGTPEEWQGYDYPEINEQKQNNPEYDNSSPGENGEPVVSYDNGL